MSNNLLTQLAEYGTYCDERQGTVTADDITDAVMPLPMPIQPTRPRHGLLIAAAAAAAVLLVAGGLALLARSGDGSTPVDEPTSTTVAAPVVTTVPEPVPTTTIAETEESTPTTTVPDRSPAVYRGMDAPMVAMETTGSTSGYGGLTWTIYESFGSSFPAGDIWFDPEIGYVAYPPFNTADTDDPTSDGRAYEWRSDDAVAWERRVLPEFDGYDYFSVHSGWSTSNSPLGLWAVAGTSDGSTLFVASGNTWQRVEFDDSARPGVEGIIVDGLRGEPISSGETTIYSSYGPVRIPWERYFGDGLAAGLRGEWDDATQHVRVVDWDTGDLYADLTVDVDADRVSFTDARSGDVVLEVAVTDEFPPESIIEAAQGKLRADVWIFDGDQRLVWTPSPFPDTAVDQAIPILPLAKGGFAAFVDNQGVDEVWTSADGRVWSNRGQVGFLDRVDGYTAIEFEPFAGKVQAHATLGESGLVESWESMDGVNWTPARFSTYGPYGPPTPTNLGWIAIDDDPEGVATFWVSADGDAWQQLGIPAGFNHADWQISGTHIAGAAGNILHLTLIGDGSGADIRREEVDPNGQWLWLGTFTAESR